MPRDDMPRMKRKKYLGPEADFYDIAKGKTIRIEFNTSPLREAVTVRLDWVDFFTIGVSDLATGQKTALCKSSFHSIERCENDGLDNVPRDNVARDGRTKRKKFIGPEGYFYGRCQDRMMRVSFNTLPPREPVTVRLDWVDRYTIGVHDATTGKNLMLFKQGIHSIERDGNHGDSENSGRL